MLGRIIVPVRGDGMAERVLAHAAVLAHRHKAHIVVTHCRASPEDMMPYSTLMPSFARETILTQAAELADQEEKAVREKLHEFAVSLDLAETNQHDGTRATVSFVEEFGRMADVVKHNGRLADLIVLPRPDRDRNLGVNSLKSALFQTGRPVLMCPPVDTVDPDFGSRVALGWNGSLEASRMVALSLDLMHAADKVAILAGGKTEPHRSTAEELRDYLAIRGIAAEIHRFEAKRPGAALVAKAGEIGASMLMMGAYGHSHERETIFGGNTKVVVENADIPVLLAH